MVQEIALRKDFFTEPLRTIYFGGGTPSILTPDEIARLLDAINAMVDCSLVEEVTFECNPENISEDYLIALKKLGITRLSIGIQSLNEDVLQSMNRSHNKQEALLAIELIRKYFSNYSVDLMYGLPPSLGAQSFKQDLLFFLNNGAPHISLYNLTIEEHTKLHNDISKGKSTSPSEEQSREEFEFLIETLKTNGYNHYEVSNASLPGFESKHNSAYWNFSPYLGIGPASHSFDGKDRYANIANNALYIKALKEKNIPQEKEELSDTDCFNEILMLGLRQRKGVDIELLKAYPTLYNTMLDSNAYKNYISNKVLKAEQNSLILQNDGIFLSDKICSDLFQ